MFNLQTIKKFSEKLFKRITKFTNWEKALILIILILPFIFNKSNIENFQQKSKFVMKENENVFDDFYCSIYDDLVYDVVKNEFEFETINKYAKPTVAVAVAANSKLFESANLLLMFDHIPLSPQSPSASSISLLLLLLLLLLLPKGVLQFGQVVLPCPSFQRFKHLL